MENINGELLGQAIGVIAVIIVGAWTVVKGMVKGDGKPPADRAPSQHEIREVLYDIRRSMQRGFKDNDDDHREITHQLDRMERRQVLRDEIQHWTDRTIPPGRQS